MKRFQIRYSQYFFQGIVHPDHVPAFHFIRQYPRFHQFQYFLKIEILGFFFPADHFERTVDVIKSLAHGFQFDRSVAHVKMPGEIPVVNGFNKLLELILRFTEEPVKIGKLPGNQRHQDDKIYKLSLDYRHSSQTEHREQEYNADEYAKLELFKHG